MRSQRNCEILGDGLRRLFFATCCRVIEGTVGLEHHQTVILIQACNIGIDRTPWEVVDERDWQLFEGIDFAVNVWLRWSGIGGIDGVVLRDYDIVRIPRMYCDHWSSQCSSQDDCRCGDGTNGVREKSHRSGLVLVLGDQRCADVYEVRCMLSILVRLRDLLQTLGWFVLVSLLTRFESR